MANKYTVKLETLCQQRIPKSIEDSCVPVDVNWYPLICTCTVLAVPQFLWLLWNVTGKGILPSYVVFADAEV